MEESGLYTARMRVVEVMERRMPGTRPPNSLGFRSVNQRPIGFVSACGKRANKRCVKAGRDARPTCEVRSESFWNRAADKPLTRPAVRFKHSCQDFGPISPCLTLARDDFEVTVAQQLAKATADIARPGVSPSQASTLYPFVRQLDEP
jgi:hypothetical protein